MSPMVIAPLATRLEACHIIAVTATAMIAAWPMLSSDSEVWLRICALAHFSSCSS